MPATEDIERIAVAACEAGGAELRRRFEAGDDEGEFDGYDVKAAADRAAEAAMLPPIRRSFPEHEVFAEETGVLAGTEPYRWIVDPLDGTNNFAAGLPTFASSVAVLHEDDPIVAAVCLPATGDAYLVRRGNGVRFRDERVTADSTVPIEAGTVVLITGRDVPRDPDRSERADRLSERLDSSVKRVIRSWAPTVHSGLFARGRLQGLVQFHPDEEERAVTELFADEAGAAVHRDGPVYVAGSDEETLEALRSTVL